MTWTPSPVDLLLEEQEETLVVRCPRLAYLAITDNMIGWPAYNYWNRLNAVAVVVALAVGALDEMLRFGREKIG